MTRNRVVYTTDKLKDTCRACEQNEQREKNGSGEQYGDWLSENGGGGSADTVMVAINLENDYRRTVIGDDLYTFGVHERRMIERNAILIKSNKN